MCKEKETAAELGGGIRRVKEVEADAAGECTRNFLRMRISVDITKPLKKIVVMEQMEKEEEESEEGNKKEDIPMLVHYERLHDFCFCCGHIGHQYMECRYYKSQSKDKLAYDSWLKATTMAERLRQSRWNDRWSTKSSLFNVKHSAGANTKLLQITEKKQRELGEKGAEEKGN